MNEEIRKFNENSERKEFIDGWFEKLSIPEKWKKEKFYMDNVFGEYGNQFVTGAEYNLILAEEIAERNPMTDEDFEQCIPHAYAINRENAEKAIADLKSFRNLLNEVSALDMFYDGKNGSFPWQPEKQQEVFEKLNFELNTFIQDGKQLQNFVFETFGEYPFLRFEFKTKEEIYSKESEDDNGNALAGDETEYNHAMNAIEEQVIADIEENLEITKKSIDSFLKKIETEYFA